MSNARREHHTTQQHSLFHRVITDMTTTPNMDFDPARVIGYGFALLVGIVFLVLEVWYSFKSGQFNAGEYAAGSASVSMSIVAASAGVLIKKNAEIQPALPQFTEPAAPPVPPAPPPIPPAPPAMPDADDDTH